MLFKPQTYNTLSELHAAVINGDAHSDTSILASDGTYKEVFGYVDGVAYETLEMSNHFDIDCLSDPEYTEMLECWTVAWEAIEPAPSHHPRAWVDQHFAW
jgi:hypothetical protein